MPLLRHLDSIAYLGKDLPNHNKNLELLQRHRTEKSDPKGPNLAPRQIIGCLSRSMRTINCSLGAAAAVAAAARHFLLELRVGAARMARGGVDHVDIIVVSLVGCHRCYRCRICQFGVDETVSNMK